jgi:diamine N-acetyltransferase
VRYEEDARRTHTDRFIVRDGAVRRLEFSLEQVPPPQLIARLRRAGFADVELFGGTGEPFEPDGPRLIALARTPRPGSRPAAGPRVSLREVDAGNVQAVCELKLAPGQERYVPPSAHTLAQAHVHEGGWIRAVYADETPVGLLALIAGPERNRYRLGRLIIGAQHQRRGFGGAAVGMLVEHVRALPGARELETSCFPGPESPAPFYRALGFEDTGRVEDGQEVLVLRL